MTGASGNQQCPMGFYYVKPLSDSLESDIKYHQMSKKLCFGNRLKLNIFYFAIRLNHYRLML